MSLRIEDTNQDTLYIHLLNKGSHEVKSSDKIHYVQILPGEEIDSKLTGENLFTSITIDARESTHNIDYIISEAASRLEENGKLYIQGLDSDAEIWTFHKVMGTVTPDFLQVINTRGPLINPELVSQIARQTGLEGPAFENRMTFPEFRLISYKKPITWKVFSSWEEAGDEVYDGNVVITENTDRDWNSDLSTDIPSKPPRYECETSLLMSCLIKQGYEDILQVVINRAIAQNYDEYLFLIDIPDRNSAAVSLIKKNHEDLQNRCTTIISADLTGICTAWNRLFKAARGKYLFINSSDFLVHGNFKNLILEGMRSDSKIAWMFGRPDHSSMTDARVYAYASCLESSALYKVGLLSPEFNPCTADDNDLAAKLISEGFSLFSHPDTVVTHLGIYGSGTCDIYHRICEDGGFLLSRQVNKFLYKWRDRKDIAQHCLNLFRNVDYYPGFKGKGR
jgi:hypothetical protein